MSTTTSDGHDFISVDMFVPGKTTNLQSYKAWHITDNDEVKLTWFATKAADFFTTDITVKTDGGSCVTGTLLQTHITLFFTQTGALMHLERSLKARLSVFEVARERAQREMDRINQKLGRVGLQLGALQA